MQTLTLLLIGELDRPEFREAAATMHAACRVVRAANVAVAVDSFAADETPPDVIVLAQARPGEHNHAELDRLRRWAALATVIVLLGPWSEGETRSGEPHPGVVRVYWHQWVPWFERQTAAFVRGACPVWGLPPTATDEERLLWSEKRACRPMRDGVVAIVAECSATADWLSAACADLGLRTVRAVIGRTADSRDVVAVLWDLLPGAGDESELAALRKMFPAAVMLVVVGFPRAADRERLLAAGAAAVLSKPLPLANFASQLEALRARP